LKIKDALSNAIQYLAPQHRNHPVASAYANLAITNVIANNTIREMQSKIAQLEQTVKDVQAGEPGPGAAKGSTPMQKQKIKGDSWGADTGVIGDLGELSE
jgi:hypothetical protein